MFVNSDICNDDYTIHHTQMMIMMMMMMTIYSSQNIKKKT